MLVRLSWRNIWRNSLRSAVIMTAIALGLAAGIFAIAMYNGMTKQMLQNAFATSLSHVRIQHPKLMESYDIKLYFSDIDNMIHTLKNQSQIKAFATRTIASAMLASSEKSIGIQAIGISPDDEKNITTISECLIHGKYFQDMKRNPILISEKIAQELNLKVRSKTVLTIQDVSGNITNSAFRVVGIFKTSDAGFDKATVFVQKQDLQKIIGLENAIHEIVVIAHKVEEISQISEALKAKILSQKIETWNEIRPELASMKEISALTNGILLGIILFALAFGILNTMLMAIYERTKEIGVLMAVGMNPSKIFIMILLETFFLAIFGAFIGVILSLISVSYYQKVGINLEQFSEGFEQFGMSTLLYPTVEPEFYLQLAIMVFITALLSALYPAWRAVKLNPVSAIRG